MQVWGWGFGVKGVRGFGRCRVHGVFMVVTDIAYIHVYSNMKMYMYIYIKRCVSVRICVHTYIHTYTHIYVYRCGCVYICMNVYTQICKG